MKLEPPREEALFQAAAQLSGAERIAFLNGACYGDPALRQRLAALLAAHGQTDSLQTTTAKAAPPATQLNLPPTEAPGDRIGNYKLLQQIGEGGCGVVYMAEQVR